MSGECSMYGTEEYLVQSLGGKLEDKRLVWRPRHRWHDNIKVSLKEAEWEDVSCVLLHQDVDQCQGDEPSGYRNMLVDSWLAEQVVASEEGVS
jgi:hypothetical protein